MVQRFLRLKGKDMVQAEKAARAEVGDAAASREWHPPDGKQTMEGMTIAEAMRWIGKDVIVRDDPNFGKKGRIVKVIPDEKHGFLAAVAVYRYDRGAWVLPPDRGPARFLKPGRFELT